MRVYDNPLVTKVANKVVPTVIILAVVARIVCELCGVAM